MKKKWLIGLMALCVSFATFIFVSCHEGNNEDNAGKGNENIEQGDGGVHTCVFDQQKAEETYKATDATCQAQARYYFSCECGEKGGETFAYGDLGGHVFDQEKIEITYKDSSATCTEKARYTYSCKCGKKGTETFEYGEYQHDFVQMVAEERYLDSKATCQVQAKYYVSCECGAKGGETFSYGELGEHAIADGACSVCKITEAHDLNYWLSADETYYIVKDIGEHANYGTLIIPSTHEDLPVKEIADRAFYLANIEEVIIPDSVTTIGERSFDGCAFLKKVVIPDNVRSIGKKAFYGCNDLTHVTIGKGVETIGVDAFARCDRLASIEVADENATYQDIDGNLYSKDGQTLIQYAIGKKATTFTIPDSVKTISKGAFYEATLTEIAIPNGVKMIGEETFMYCEKLKEIVIPDSVETIATKAFYHCEEVTSIAIGNGVETISDYAFYYCKNLQSLALGDKVTTIGAYAFYYGKELTEIVIGDKVTTIGEKAFMYCDKLENVYYKGTASDWQDITIKADNSSLINATKNYYIENEADLPTDGGNYWHYVDGVPTAW